MARNRSRGRYAPLSGHYYFDDRIAEVGPEAELLYVRGLAFCAATLSDGFISAPQVTRAVGMGLHDVEALAGRLVAVGLWVHDAERNGYQVRQWLKWNSSTDEIDRFRTRDAARKRSARSPDGVQSESTGSPRTNTIQNNTKQESGRTQGSGPAGLSASAPPDLTEVRNTLKLASTAAKRPRRGGAS